MLTRGETEVPTSRQTQRTNLLGFDALLRAEGGQDAWGEKATT